VVKEVPVPVADGKPFIADERKREDLGITRRELEILELIAEAMNNREIAEKLYVSENTVKTHSSRVFDKLGARRRMIFSLRRQNHPKGWSCDLRFFCWFASGWPS
jgi:NarL family two-component system response regulator LiaR